MAGNERVRVRVRGSLTVSPVALVLLLTEGGGCRGARPWPPPKAPPEPKLRNMSSIVSAGGLLLACPRVSSARQLAAPGVARDAEEAALGARRLLCLSSAALHRS